MKKRNHYSNLIREEVVGYYGIGMKIKDILAKLGVKQGSIDGIIKRSKLQTDFEDRPSGNHHIALSDRKKRLIIRFIRREPLITPSELKKQIPTKVSISTIRRFIKASKWEKIPHFVSPGFSQMRLL